MSFLCYCDFLTKHVTDHFRHKKKKASLPSLFNSQFGIPPESVVHKNISVLHLLQYGNVYFLSRNTSLPSFSLTVTALSL